MRVLAALWLICHLAVGRCVFHEGDFIHAARRSQLLKKRTHWRDLTEHHCPRFNQERLVAMPIQRPEGVPDGEIKDFRLQLSFDGDRVVTPWVPVIGRGLVGMPLLEVLLHSAGDELKGARIKAVPLPDEFLVTHEALYSEFKNATHWPKHVLVRYAWDSEPDADLDAGLYVLFIYGLVMAGLMAASALASVQSKVAEFFREVVGDPLAAEPLVSGAGSYVAVSYAAPPKRGGHVE